MPIFTQDPENGASLSDALREAATYAPIDKVLLVTYEFTHSSFTSRALVVISHDNVIATDEDSEEVEFVAIAGLRSEGMEESDKIGTPTIKLTLDGMSAMLLENLDKAVATLEPVGIIERVYMSDDLSGPAIMPPARAHIMTAEVDEGRITIEAGIGDAANQPFPRRNYTRAEYPGLPS